MRYQKSKPGLGGAPEEEDVTQKFKKRHVPDVDEALRQLKQSEQKAGSLENAARQERIREEQRQERRGGCGCG